MRVDVYKFYLPVSCLQINSPVQQRNGNSVIKNSAIKSLEQSLF
jgi:hypothetical protein